MFGERVLLAARIRCLLFVGATFFGLGLFFVAFVVIIFIVFWQRIVVEVIIVLIEIEVSRILITFLAIELHSPQRRLVLIHFRRINRFLNLRLSPKSAILLIINILVLPTLPFILRTCSFP